MPENDCELFQTLAFLFYKGSLAFTLSPKAIETLSWEQQEKFLNITVNSEKLLKYPVKRKFSRLFFKKLINYLQDSGQEIHDGLFSFLCSVMSEIEEKFCFRHYVISNDFHNTITLKETNNLVMNGTTGLKTWEAALMLTDWILCNKDLFMNKNILELGAGVGFTGISIAKFCHVKSILLTDFHNEVLKTICENIEINFPRLNKEGKHDEIMFSDNLCSMGVMPLDWNHIEDLPLHVTPDVIIGADISYDPSMLVPLCSVLKKLFERNSQLEVYVENIIRHEETFNMFLNLLGKMSFKVEKLPQERPVLLQWDVTTKKCLTKITVF